MNKCCEYCRTTGNNHLHGCPNYEMPYSAYKCDYCDEGIYDGEKYITKYECGKGNRYVHLDCIPDIEWLCEWYGIDIETMKNCEY